MQRACKWLEHRRALPLLISLISLMLVPPLLRDRKLTGLCFGLVMLATMFTAIYAMAEKRHFRIVVVASLATCLVILLSLFTDSFFVELLNPVLNVVSLSIILSITLHHSLSSSIVDRDRIFAVIAGYLMLGIIWAYLYGIVEALAPGSFSMGGDGHISNVGDGNVELLYFSFVTLTTLGYGDVSPVLPFAQSLAVLEAATGILYIAVLVASLMGQVHGTAARVLDDPDKPDSLRQ
jgi:hypothetical protein